jgi:TonB family protein
MIRRVALVIPLAFALGCGAAAPQAAAPPAPEDTGKAAAPEAAKASAPAASAAPAPQAPPGSAAPAPIGGGVKSASVTPAPLAGGISQDEVMNQVGKSNELTNKCYTVGAGSSKSWRAKVTIKATVGPNGAVNSVEVLSSTAKNPKVDACVVEAFKKLVFPRPAGAGTTTFTFPMNFEPMEQVQ